MPYVGREANSFTTVVDVTVSDDLTVTDDATIGGDLAVTGTTTSTGKITADAGIDIDNFNIDGTTIALSSGDMTLDAAGNITLDADGGNIRIKDGGTEYGTINKNSTANLSIYSSASDADLLLQGNDGGSVITALTLDMSAAVQLPLIIKLQLLKWILVVQVMT